MAVNTEAVDPRYHDLDAWPLDRLIAELVSANRRAVSAAEAAADSLTAAAEAVAARLEQGGRLIYIGAGTSGRLAAQDAVELEPTFGFDLTSVLLAGGPEAAEKAREGAEDDEAAARSAIERADVGSADAVIAVAASGTTAFTVAGLRHARGRGAHTVGIANNPGAELLAAAHSPVLLDTGPEVLAGSTRLVAGTAQKIALNALSTAVMIRLGGAYRNLMVGMRPTNDKLRARAVKVVAAAAEVREEEAFGALERARWDIRLALVSLAGASSAQQSARALEASGNRVRSAIAMLRSAETEEQ